MPSLLTAVARQECDGGDTVKTLWRLFDGAQVESVLMRYPDRVTVCVSSQAGCGINCPFCATGQAGLTRNLSTAEIVEQVVRPPRGAGELAPTGERVGNVVLMGMGEPLANYPAVISALRRLTDPAPDGLGLSARGITVSTVGLVPAVDRLAAEGLPVTLALSLHAPDDELRDELVPVNTRWPVAEVLDAGRRYFEVTGRRVSIEYALIRTSTTTPGGPTCSPGCCPSAAGGGCTSTRSRSTRLPGPGGRPAPPGRSGRSSPGCARPASPPRSGTPAAGRSTGHVASLRRLVANRPGAPSRAGRWLHLLLTSGRIESVSDTFPRARRLAKGYDVEQVETFLARARMAYEEGGRGPAMTSWHVRTVGFDLVRGGYDVDAVDAALDRIEDAFARKEKQRGEERNGPSAWQTQLRTQEQSLRAQLARPDGQRFPPGHRHGADLRRRRRRRPLPADRGLLLDRSADAAGLGAAGRVQESPGRPRVPRGVRGRLPRPRRRAARRPDRLIPRPPRGTVLAHAPGLCARTVGVSGLR